MIESKKRYGGTEMTAEELYEKLKKIQKMKCESQTLELKTAKDGYPKRLYDTLSSFSNQDDGGTIIFGIDEKKDYKETGVYDAQDIQKKINEQCLQMQPVVRPLLTVVEKNGKFFVSAEIPGIDITERPCYYQGRGRLKGSYTRIGDSDEPMTEYEVYSYEAYRKKYQDDIREVSRVTMASLDQTLLDEYINQLKKGKPRLAAVENQAIYELMSIKRNNEVTLSATMMFSPYPQAYFPQLCITAVVVPGTEIGEIGEDGERFIDNERITGSIPEMLDLAVDFVRRNSRTKTVVDENGVRKDKKEYPIIAVREAILNALIHRDYSIHTENVPIRLEMYRDRMEIVNSGGLYGKISIDSLGKVRPETRNPVLANILELLNITENRYSGIPTIRKEFEKAGLPAPIFSVKHGEFKVVFKNNIYKNEMFHKTGNMQEDIISFCMIPRSRKELIEFTGMSRYYTMTFIIQPLLESGKLKQTLPEKPKSSKQRYVKA